ncbi:hypothetical protein POWCR01_000127300 [Plasmodium ovale]|uniref:PIR protein n=1 Tax=Plasmodium ovale TaxID=36330 RepID=A0A1C3KIR7_PLAOA|nr:hypothetical protein POWCR01_000127300 [Plasmodium ovale]
MLDTITTYINNLFSNSNELGCKAEFYDLTNAVSVRKNLDYFCENGNFTQKNLNEKFSCLECIWYAVYVKSQQNNINDRIKKNQLNGND